MSMDNTSESELVKEVSAAYLAGHEHCEHCTDWETALEHALSVIRRHESAAANRGVDKEQLPGVLPDGINYCLHTAPDALRFLAKHQRPYGGNSKFNSEHLEEIAKELDRTREERMRPYLTQQDRVIRDIQVYAMAQVIWKRIDPKDMIAGMGIMPHRFQEAMEDALRAAGFTITRDSKG